MPSAAAAAQQGASPRDGQPQAPQIPFIVGSNLYREAPFVTTVQQLDANAHETVANITPGGFLRGVTCRSPRPAA
jgi:hypothetical protein